MIKQNTATFETNHCDKSNKTVRITNKTVRITNKTVRITNKTLRFIKQISVINQTKHCV